MKTTCLHLFRISLLAGFLILTAVPGICSGATTRTVQFGGSFGLRFSPTNITVNVGDTIIFTNLSSPSAIHTVTGLTPPETFCGSGFIPTSCSHTFNVAGAFAYQCNNHFASGMTGSVIVVSGSVPPTISITNPVEGSVFTAPASVRLFAVSATSNGSVTNVQFFSNGAPLGSISSPPFSWTNSFTPGSYALTATATDSGGQSATSAPPVNITVVNAKAITNSLAQAASGFFSFDYGADAGLRYVVQISTNLMDWTPLATNTAASNNVHVSESFDLDGIHFYRVGRLPNP